MRGPATQLRPGDFGVVATGGFEAKVIRWGTESTVNHAFVYIGAGQIVEAEPGGACVSPVKKYGDRPIWSSSAFDLDDMTRRRIASGAVNLCGIPYGWLDIVAIAFAQRRTGELVNPLRPPWWVRRIESLHTLICSQLVDVAYEGGGVNLFTDGRPPGLVSPGDLLDLIRNRAAVTR